MAGLRLCLECGEEKDAQGFKEFVPVEIHEKLPGPVTLVNKREVCAGCYKKLEASESKG